MDIATKLRDMISRLRKGDLVSIETPECIRVGYYVTKEIGNNDRKYPLFHDLASAEESKYTLLVSPYKKADGSLDPEAFSVRIPDVSILAITKFHPKSLPKIKDNTPRNIATILSQNIGQIIVTQFDDEGAGSNNFQSDFVSPLYLSGVTPLIHRQLQKPEDTTIDSYVLNGSQSIDSRTRAFIQKDSRAIVLERIFPIYVAEPKLTYRK